MDSHLPFRLMAPDRLAAAAVFNSPHSGRDYPAGLVRRSRLTRRGLRASEDVLIDALFAAAPEHGAPLLAATAPRAWLDLNRAPSELDPALIRGVRRQGLNQRVAAGLGVIPRVVSEGAKIYRGKITLEEAQARIRDVHEPYHAMLERLLARARDAFGMAVLFDCHSMPSEALR
ncbi:MAG: N-formylglutamate amidohydrolase, partial [Paracoccaceae bacterium]